MKNNMIQMLLLVILLAAGNVLHAQSKEQEYIHDKLYIYYVENPNDENGRVWLLMPKDIYRAEYLSATGDFWSNPEMEEAQKLVKKLFQPFDKGGSRSLQKYTYDILKIQDKDVQFWLYNDSKQGLNKFARDEYDPCTDSDRKVWPCAYTLEKDEKEAALWAGVIHMGIDNMIDYGSTWTSATFLHELMHTQDQSNHGAHIFYSYAAEKGYKYGADGDHYFEEAVPSLYAAYQEGIANAISMLFDPDLALSTFQWFANNDLMLVESTKDRKANDLKKDVWIYDKIQAKAGPGKVIKHMPAYRGYPIRDLPAEFIIHNEMIIALTASEFVHHISLGRFLRAVKQVNKQAARNPQHSVAVFFEKLCELGLPRGVKLEDIYMQDHGYSKKYMLPLAYADYFTGYQAKTKEEFSSIFKGELKQEWIDMYWEAEKNLVRRDVPAQSPKYTDLAEIAIALQINSSEQDDEIE